MLKIFRRTPLAWLQVKREKQRLAVALAGIAFADVLMFVQLGLNDTLYESAASIQNLLQGDLFLINPISETVVALSSFPKERVYQAAGFAEVESVNYVYMGSSQWQNPEQKELQRTVLTIGFDPAKPVFNLPEVNRQLPRIQLLDRVLFDRASRAEFGDIASLFQQDRPLSVQVNDRQLWVAGLFKLGVSFGASGTMLASDSTFLRLFPDRKSDRIDVGLVEVKPGTNLKQLQAALRDRLPDDVLVLTLAEFGDREKQYWSSSTPTGFIFGFGTVIGFIVGIVIVYQILYSDVSDHLPEYATLKAMGYSDSYLVGILIQESLILAILGFIPGFVLSSGLYVIAGIATLLPIGMTFNRAVLVLFLTVVMCTVSGTVAMSKLQGADPADIF
ncbi:ABC transporter permease DevC [Microcoleus sp. herbarium19]|uniref:ABC transporter permease DevC n=1 Tax=unclassified Microcoleus TaxID=2642155 RepID=UPI002FD3DE29